MAEQTDAVADALQRQRALARWDNDGGAAADGPEPGAGQPPFPNWGDAEFEALHIRVIALENLVITLLAAASDQDRERAREMAEYIAPRPGFTRHKLTTHAAEHMSSLIARAQKFFQRANGTGQ